MWAYWADSPEYSHSMLIPFVSAFLIWQQRDKLERMPFDGSAWGVLVVLLGAALLVLGQLSTTYSLVECACLLTLWGLVLSFTGVRAFRFLAMPLLILVFMIPLPQFVLNDLSLQLQLLSSRLGVAMMQLLDISAYREGNVIDLGGYQLQVADACSGLRYLFPLMTLGFLVAYFYKGALWKRCVIFCSSVPITLLMNSMRVATIGVMVEHWGIGAAEGFLHEFQGWVVFMLCAALLLGESVLLNRIGHERGSWQQLFGVELPAPTPAGARVSRRRLPGTFIAAAALLCALLLGALALPRPSETTPARTSFAEFPTTLDDWRGRPQAMEAVYLDTLKLDDYLLADYARPQGPPVNLYIAYYRSQRKGESAHSPRSCLPGGGWQMQAFRTRDLGSPGHPLDVNRVIIEQGNQRELVYYWFQQRGRIIDNEFAVKWYLFWDAMTRHRSDGALVRLITPVEGDAEAQADARLTALAAQITPLLPRYVPN